MSAGEAEAHWADLELAAWRGVTIQRDYFDDALRTLALQIPSMFLLKIDDGGVSLIDKDVAAALSDNLADAMMFRARAALYAEFLQAVVTAHRIDGRALLAIGLHDRSAVRFPVPTFCFQKQRASDAILLPDVDLLNLGFFEDQIYQDDVPFSGKRDEAVFAGSTTGGLITRQAVLDRTHPRIDAAIFFKGKSGVSFTLPEIIQCDGPATVEQIRQLGIGGARRRWRDQLEYKYLLSMDGNGAACSRVALALHSSSLLVKYNSPHLLYYFHGLEAWRNYIPVRRHSDVIDIIDRAEFTKARDEMIAERSARFARTHLSRSAVMCYAANLLIDYIGLFGRR